MKQQLKRLKGQTVPTSIGQLQLKQYYRPDHSEYDHLYYTTNQQFLLCKIYNITNQTSLHRFDHQKLMYQMEVYPNLATCINKTQVSVRKISYGLLILSELPKNTAINDIGNSLSFFQLLKLTKTVLQLIKQLKTRNQVFLNLRPQNVCLNSQKNFVIINPQYICPKGNHSQLQDMNQLFFSNVEKYFKYNSPQVLDNYTYFAIDSKSDIFSLGCILYETIYGKYPFQSKFANINIIYQKQQGFFGKFIQKIFKPYKQRSEVEQLLQIIEQELKKNPTEPKQTNTSSTAQSKSSKNAHSFFDDISSVFNKYTKQTQGAYINFTQDNQSFPQTKHLNFILNKLYKNPNKIEKLQSIMSKHIKSTQYGTRKNFVIKNLVLIFLLLRKNRNYMINKWRDNICQIKQALPQNSQCLQFSQLLLRKIQLQEQLNCILRGNFYLQDVCQFKLLYITNLVSMMKYLDLVLSFANKLVTYKEDDYLFHFVLQVVCDQVYDLISMIIFSVICIRKDNQLQLRKDNLADLNPLEKGLNSVLKKIANLSNKISSHAIYSIQGDYYNYKEDIYLKENPQYTSFQYFIKHSNYYKGLALPQTNNFSSLNESESRGQFGSFQANNDKPQPNTAGKKFFGNQMSSDQDEQSSSMNQIPLQSGISSKTEQQKSNKPISSQIPTKPNNINNLFGNNVFQPPQTLKKAKSTEKPFSAFNIQNKSTQNQQLGQKVEVKQPIQKIGFDDFTNFFAADNKKPQNIELSKKDSNTPKHLQLNKQKTVQNKSNDIFQNFSFFQEQANKKQTEVKQNESKEKKSDVLNWVNFNEPTKKQSDNQKQGIKIDPNILKEDIFSYDWLKKSEQNPFGMFVQVKENKQPTQQQQPQKLAPYVTQIISSLKLKQLKDLILKNKQVAIEFEKLVFDKVIGSGSAGEVYLGKYNNQAVAIKKVKVKENPNALKEFERQLVTYIKIKRNPYLVSLVGLSKSGEDFYLLTEFCSSGSLFDLLHKKAGQIFLSWKVKMSLILQIAKGMKALHDMKPPIIHRDMKSLNVFISFQNNQWIAKVADFGLSRSPEAQMMTMALGTLHWMAPELLDNKQYSLKVDVYSFAVVMWQICARKTPYYQLSNPMAIMKYVTIDKKRPNMTIIDINCPPKLLELIQLCWDEEPNKRPQFNKIIQILTQIDSTVPSQ